MVGPTRSPSTHFHRSSQAQRNIMSRMQRGRGGTKSQRARSAVVGPTRSPSTHFHRSSQAQRNIMSRTHRRRTGTESQRARRAVLKVGPTRSPSTHFHRSASPTLSPTPSRSRCATNAVAGSATNGRRMNGGRAFLQLHRSATAKRSVTEPTATSLSRPLTTATLRSNVVCLIARNPFGRTPL